MMSRLAKKVTQRNIVPAKRSRLKRRLTGIPTGFL